MFFLKNKVLSLSEEIARKNFSKSSVIVYEKNSFSRSTNQGKGFLEMI